MGSISPVLEAYLRGQQQQTSIIEQAKSIADRQAELKQRQQTIDEVVRQHDLENTHNNKMYDLAVQAHDTQRQAGNLQAMKDLQEGLKNGSIPIPGISMPGGINVAPQTNAPVGAGGDAPVLPATPTSGVSIPGAPVQVQSPNYTGATPYGPITVPTPTTTALQDKINDYNATTGDTKSQLLDFKNYQLTSQLGMKDQALAQQKQISDNNLAQHELLYKLGIDSKEQIAFARAEAASNARYNYMTPEQYKQEVQSNATGVATGQMNWAQVDPKQRAMVREELNSRKMTDLPVKTADDIMSSAGSAARFLKIAPALKAVAGNSTTSDVASNVVRNIVSKTPFYTNPKVSQFNSLLQPLLPDIEKAQGLSLARAGSSPLMATQQKNIMPAITDTADVIDSKIRNATDVHLSDLANKMSNLTPEHRQLMWKRIITENPELKEAPKAIYDAVQKAVKTGKYTSIGGQ